jgi:hypothetical protein
MTVAFIDTPGSILPSVSEPIDFTVTKTPVAISVSFGSGLTEERVYRDGAFLYPYLGSTQSGGGTTFSLVRTGGWPRNIQVYVDEQTVIPTAGQAFGAVYSVDLTAQPSQDMSAAGSYTIDGKTWWAKGALPAGCTNALVNGQGLRLAIDDTHYLTASWRSGLSYTGRTPCMSLAQLADFNPAAPYALEWRFTSPYAPSNNNDQCHAAGVMSAVLSSANITNTEKDSSMTLLFWSRVAGSMYLLSPPSAGAVTLTTTYGSTNMGDSALGLYRINATRYVPMYSQWTGALGTPDDTQAMADANVPIRSIASLSSAPAFVFALQKPFIGTGSAVDVYLTHLRVLQPKVVVS